MISAATDTRLLATQGLAALKRGEPHTARDLLVRVVQASGATASVWFALATAYRQLNNSVEESRALDQALKVDPNYLPALIGKCDFLARMGDERAASANYRVALRLADSLPFQPAERRAELDRIAAARKRRVTLRCPATTAALREVPICRAGHMSAVLFSLLRPGARIGAHHGSTNVRLTCHLPLIAPKGCAIRAGNETRAWREGEIVAFDDSVEHEAWNLSQELQVVLSFEVWRPELSEKERILISSMLDARDQFDRLPQRV